MNISLIPVPGLENDNVDPIPTPEIVPNPTVSTGLKYNSLFNTKSSRFTEFLILKVKLRGSCDIKLLAVWEVPTVESYSLKL